MWLTDSLIRAPLFASMLMCFASSLVGALLFLRKRSLLGETLSHATYPGIALAALFAGSFGFEGWLPLLALLAAALSAACGHFALDALKKHLKMSDDAALCFVLSAFFALGALIVSEVQVLYPEELRTLLAYLYGQASTMRDIHIFLYAFLALFTLCVVFLFFKELHVFCFDSQFAKTGALPKADLLLLFLSVLCIVTAIRCVGVVLMSSMLIAPPLAARQFVRRFAPFLLLSALIGMGSAALGFTLSFLGEKQGGSALPTGPLIALVAALFAFLSLLCAPSKGLLFCYLRITLFRFRCLEENLIKTLWRYGEEGKEMIPTGLTARFSLFLLQVRGLAYKKEKIYLLTQRGKEKGDKVVRLHRLWEAYLVADLGMGIERVHRSAEEIEHILTADLERQLTTLLKDPSRDPHDKPIPPSRVAL